MLKSARNFCTFYTIAHGFLDVEGWIPYNVSKNVWEGIGMPRTEAQDRAIKKYEKDKIDKVLLRLPKGKKEAIQMHITVSGESLNGFINRAIDMAMFIDEQKKKE